MTRPFCALISVLMLHYASAVSQTDSSQRSYEIGGSVWFENTYSEQTRPDSYLYHTNHRDRHLLINPIVGYYLTPAFELIGEMRYDYLWATTYWRPLPSSSSFGPQQMHSHMHTMTIGIGLRYNIELTRDLVPFIGLGGEVTWSKLGVADDEDPIDYKHWTAPNYQMPVASVGARYFVSEDWAAIVEFKYRDFINVPVVMYYRTRSYSLSIGATTFL